MDEEDGKKASAAEHAEIQKIKITRPMLPPFILCLTDDKRIVRGTQLQHVAVLF
jgi:hypothetical protein